MKNRAFLMAFIIVALGVIEVELITCFDRPVSEFMRGLDASHPAFIDVFRAYTDAAKGKVWIALSVLGVACCAIMARFGRTESARRRAAQFGPQALFLFAAVAVSGLATDLLKILIGRARPVILEREGFFGFDPINTQAAWNSMPSGHATTAFAVMGVLMVVYPRGRIIWAIGGLLLALSRVMVNAHYVADVVAGAAVGLTSVAILTPWLTNSKIIPLTKRLFPIDGPRESA